MRCLIDANVILDVLSDREPFVKDSSMIWKLCETEQIGGYLSALTFADLVCVLRKELNPEGIEMVLNSLKLIFHITELNAADLSSAAALRWKDFEDALQTVTASRNKAECIITSNTKDYKQSHIKALTPQEVISAL